MRLWTLSDLHMESTRGWDLPSPALRPPFDVLVVAGDLVSRMDRGARWLLERVQDKKIVYVAGNHEGYGGDVDRTIEKAMAIADGTNLSILQNRSVTLNDVIFAGATLWTDFDLFGNQRRAMAVAGERMNDFKRIRIKHYAERFQPRHALARHQESRVFLETEMRKPRSEKRLVVVTHHAPVPENVHSLAQPNPAVRMTDEELLTAAYRSDLTALMSPSPAKNGSGALKPAQIWIHGHTHETVDVVVGNTRIVSNGKGYGPFAGESHWENSRFDPRLIVEI